MLEKQTVFQKKLHRGVDWWWQCMHALSLESKGTKNSVSIWSMVTSESAWATWVLLSNGYKPESNTQTMCRLAFSHVSPIRDQRLRGLATVRLCFSLQKFMHLVALGIGFGERYLTNNQSNNNNNKLSSKQCTYCRFCCVGYYSTTGNYSGNCSVFWVILWVRVHFLQYTPP